MGSNLLFVWLHFVMSVNRTSLFMHMYGTEKQCRERLFNIRWKNGYVCSNCASKSYCELKSRSLYQCNKCHHQTSLTAGTLFAHSKLPLTTCFLAIYLITQDKNSISALELKRKLGVSYNAAWRIKHKLMPEFNFEVRHSLISSDHCHFFENNGWLLEP